jgi:pyridoxamine 5'-phosphate oxidase
MASSSLNIADLRKEYSREALDEQHVANNPIEQFNRWFDEALAAALPEPTAMILSTATTDGFPSSRTVLLKGIDTGFVFYTNYQSRKGRELDANPKASLLFFWPELERQVRIEGVVERVSAAEADAYFQSRPIGSRHGAWASPQSDVIDSRGTLEERLRTVVDMYPDVVPRPPFWGGYRVLPQRVEFWQGRPSRLHDRICYRAGSSAWTLERLAP